MKNMLSVKFSIGLVLFFAFTGTSFAGSNMSIPVSCSIPAVPGLNAPLVDTAPTDNPEPKAVITEKNILPAGSNGQAVKIQIELLQKDSQETGKTIYPR